MNELDHVDSHKNEPTWSFCIKRPEMVSFSLSSSFEKSFIYIGGIYYEKK